MIPFYRTYPQNLASQVHKIPEFEANLIRVTPTQEELLAKQIDETNRLEKEQQLLAKQLALPPHLRNKELMMKYKMNVDNAVLNGYRPDVDSAGNLLYYHYRCYFPIDDKIPTEHRPVDSFSVEIGDIVSSRGDKFTFSFPVSRTQMNVETGIAYKLDNFDTYLDDERNWIPTEGIFDIFPALLLYKKKDVQYAQQILEIFHRYNILESIISPSQLFDSSTRLDFRIKNKGVSVVATAIAEAAHSKVTTPTVEVGVSTKASKVIEDIQRHEDTIDKKVFWMINEDNKVQRFEADEGAYSLERVYSNSVGLSKNTFRVFSGDGKYIVINGTIPGVKVQELQRRIADSNTKFDDMESKKTVNRFKITDPVILKVMAAKDKK